MEKKDRNLCLYECLKVAGLQSYYASLTSAGVHSAAHLSRLTMEDYPVLGICSMEDRTQLFQLIQVVKTLAVDSEDDEFAADGGKERCTEAESGANYDGCGVPAVVCVDEDETGAAESFTKASCVRKLDFSCESINHHEKLSAQPAHDGVCQNNKHKPDVVSHRYNEPNKKPDIVRQSSMLNCNTSLSPECVLPHVQKYKPLAIISKRVSNNGGRGMSWKQKPVKEIICKETFEQTATSPVYQTKTTTGYNYGLPLSSTTTPQKRQPGGQRIQVCVRKRPLTHTECRRRETDVVTTHCGECVIVHESKEAVDLRHYILQHRFYFDHVFGEESSNEEVYQRTVHPLVQHMLSGGKATCFAYGQTGAGKTHTMLGSPPKRPGMYTLAAQDIYAHLSTTHTHSPKLVYVSFFEIYCGQLYDLLDHRKRLFAREDGQKMVHIAGLRVVSVDSISSLLEVISQGTEARTQGMSGVNPRSSRSHALLQIQLRRTNQQITGKMWFVDLAGSERASDAKEPGRQSRVEGAEINQSLLALKECIRSLDQEQLHTPFRQSKLTQILKDSFVGDSMTCMIANISPGNFATEHTLNTLRYAERVKELRRRRGGRSKITPSSKHNQLSSGGSSTRTTEKSPQKKANAGKENATFSPSEPASRLTTGGTILCSTAKSSKWAKERKPRKMSGLEHITPIRDLLGTSDKRERRKKAGQMRDRRSETYGGNDKVGLSLCEPNIGARVVFTQSTEKMQRKSVLYHGEKVDQQSNLEDERRRKEDERCQLERPSITDLQKVDERETEKRRHLKWYHQQLQQFIPSPATSPDCQFPFLTSDSSPLSSFSHDSFTSSVTSHPTVSSHMSDDLEKASEEYRPSAENRTDRNNGQLSSFPCRDIHFKPEPSPRHNKKTLEFGSEDSGTGISKDWRVSYEGTEAGFVDGRLSVLSLATAETEQIDDPSSAQSPHQQAPAERPLSPTLKHTDKFRTTNKVNDVSPTFKNTSVTSNILPVAFGTPQQGVSPSNFKEKEKFAAKACRREGANSHSNFQPLKAPITQTGCETISILSENPDYIQVNNHSKAKNKISASAQGQTSTDCLSYIMDPLSISVLGVNQQIAPASFLQRQHSNSSLSCTDKHCGIDTMNPLVPKVMLVTTQNQEGDQKPRTAPVIEVMDNKAPASLLKSSAPVETCAMQSISSSVQHTGSYSSQDLRKNSGTQLPLKYAHSVQNKLDSSTSKQKSKTALDQLNSPSNMQIRPIIHLSMLEDFYQDQWHIVQAHWEQLEEMETLCDQVGTLLYHQPDMAFNEYVCKLLEIMERKARCVHRLIAQLQPYLKTSHCNQANNQGVDNEE